MSGPGAVTTSKVTLLPLTVERARADVDAITFVNARVAPRGSLENLSHGEVAKLLDRSQGGLYPLFRRCALAVMSSGSYSDDARALLEQYRDFELKIVQRSWGIKLDMHHAPGGAFVDGEMIRGVKEHLSAVLRDIIYTADCSRFLQWCARTNARSSPIHRPHLRRRRLEI